MLSLPAGQQAGQTSVPKNKSQVLKMGKVFIGCPVSSPGWGVQGRSGAPSPSINKGASGSWCRCLMAPNHDFRAGGFSHIALSPGHLVRLSLRLHPRKVRSPFHLYLQSIQRLLRGSSFRQGLPFAGSVSVSVSRAATQPSALATCLRATRVWAPPRTPWHLGYPAARLMDASTECASAGCSAP